MAEKTSPQPDTGLDRQKEQKHASFTQQNAAVKAQIVAIQAEIDATTSKLSEPDSASTVAGHIKRLHQYNEIKDIAQALMGLIAEAEGKRQGDIEERFGVSKAD